LEHVFPWGGCLDRGLFERHQKTLEKGIRKILDSCYYYRFLLLYFVVKSVTLLYGINESLLILNPSTDFDAT